MRAKSLLLFITGFCALFLCGTAQAEVEVGKPAPAFIATTLNGKSFDLSTLKGKVVVLHYWATWCAACREEMPALEAVWRRYHGKGMEVLAISVDRPRARGDVDQVMKYFTFPVSLVNAISKNDFGTVAAIPVTYVIGKDGNVEAVMTPDTQPLTAAGLEDEVKKLLDAKTDVKPETKTDAKP